MTKPAWQQEVWRLLHQVSPAAGIFASVGVLVAAWSASGILPLLVHSGLDLVSPQYFLPGAALACAALSFATGTSWGTVSTLGVAMMGVARGLGVDPAAAAGAIVAGAHFGDKLSPLSETATLAATVAGTQLYTHLRHTLYTTVPAFVFTAVVLGMLPAGIPAAPAQPGLPPAAAELQAAIAQHYRLTPLLWLPVVLVLLAAVRQWPVVPSLLGSAAGALALALGLQHVSWQALPALLWLGYRPATGHPLLDSLLRQGGLWPMAQVAAAALGLFAVVALALHALQRRGALAVVGRAARTPARAVALAIAACLAVMFASGSSYLTLVAVGTLLRPAFADLRLAPQNLSRTLEDAGTVVAPLVPWGVSGLFMAQTLGVETWQYAPYAVSNYLGFCLALLYGYTGWWLPRQRSASGQCP